MLDKGQPLLPPHSNILSAKQLASHEAGAALVKSSCFASSALQHPTRLHLQTKTHGMLRAGGTPQVGFLQHSQQHQVTFPFRCLTTTSIACIILCLKCCIQVILNLPLIFWFVHPPASVTGTSAAG